MNRTACKIDIRRIKILGRSKPAFLIKLSVVREICLWYYTKYLSTLDNHSAVVEQAVYEYRRSNDKDSIEFAGEVEKLDDTLFCLVQQQLLSEQVLATVTRDAQFRSNEYLHSLTFSLSHEALYLHYIVIYVSHLDCRYSRCDIDKSVLHNLSVFII